MCDNLSFDYPKCVHFVCERCALCCGDTQSRDRTILLLKLEADRISKKTLMNVKEFAEEVEEHDPYVYQVKKTVDGKCVFLNEKTCTIYSVRPLICRFYPLELKEAGIGLHVFSYTDECPSIGKGPQLRRGYFKKLFDELENTMKEV